MKRVLAVLLILSGLCAVARAEVSAQGVVQCGATVSQAATMGGMVKAVDVMAGDYVYPGDPLVTLTPNRVFAPCSGTVESVFAELGESADAAVEQYGGAVSIAPESLYTVYATMDYAYDSVRTSRISSGQTVYLKCTSDGTHRGTGRVTRIEEAVFLVETTGGRFYNGETVYVCMDSDCDSSDRLGKGTVLASEAVSVKAEGFVSRVYVQPGDFVEKGQLLLETLSSLPADGFIDADGVIRAQAEGYVTAVYAQVGGNVEKGDMLIDLCPAGVLEVIARISAGDLPAVSVGSRATAVLELAEDTLRIGGSVSAVSYIPENDESGNTTYAVRLSLDALAESSAGEGQVSTARVARPGMHVTVTVH